jgi:tetratricopeptide (TPR) repeat protein
MPIRPHRRRLAGSTARRTCNPGQGASCARFYKRRRSPGRPYLAALPFKEVDERSARKVLACAGGVGLRSRGGESALAQLGLANTAASPIELIPDDPNPYDSYAELLMKTGRFAESIGSYEKALAVDRYFVASYVGIGLDQIYMGQPQKARETFARLEQVARNGGEKRAAYAQNAFSYVIEGNAPAAVKEIEKMKAVARQENDTSALAGDANFIANVLLESGQVDEAARHFAESLKLAESADTNDDVKQAARRQALFDAARVALARGEVAGATAKAAEYAAAGSQRKIPFEVRQGHEIAGLIALQARDYAKAGRELAQANLLDPRVQYHLARAYQGQGDAKAAREAARQAADHNGLNFNYAYVRSKAKELLAQL